MAGIEAILFDAYGTLFDLRSAVTPHAARLGDRIDRVFGALASEAARIHLDCEPQECLSRFRYHHPGRPRLRLAAEKIADPSLAAGLLQSFHALAPYPDAGATLQP